MQPDEGFSRETGSTNVLEMARRLEINARMNAERDRRNNTNSGTTLVTSSPRGDGRGQVSVSLSSPRMLMRSNINSHHSQVASPRAAYVNESTKEKEALKAANSELEKSHKVLLEENKRLQEEIQRLQTAASVEAMAAEAPAAASTAPPDHSEGRLRAAMTKKGVTCSELRNAIRGVESLLDEAKRELRNAELREQRSAMEALHQAIDKADELDLEMAIERARLAEVSAVDITKGEDKLRDLRSMTPEQKNAKAAAELENKNKKEAYLLIKKDDTEALRALLDGLDPSVRWKDWRDYAGRTLWKCAVDLRARRQQEYLAPLFGQRLPEDPNRPRRSVDQREQPPSPEFRPSVSSMLPRLSSASGDKASAGRVSVNSHSPKASEHIPSRQVSSEGEQNDEAPLAAQDSPGSVVPVFCSLAREDTVNPDSCMSPGTMSPSRIYEDGDPETAELRQKALRAVAQDDVYMLEEVLGVVNKDVWERWQNKAGKDLLTLSQERGSSAAYSLLARSLGILKELEREAFEEREAVWVFENGEVQPRRATVLEDTPPEEEMVYVEFWDGDEPPQRVERCQVRKIN